MGCQLPEKIADIFINLNAVPSEIDVSSEMLYEAMRPMKVVIKIRKTSALWALDQAKQFMMATFPGLF